MNRRLIGLLAILMAFALVAAACGNSGDEDEGTQGDAEVGDSAAGTDSDAADDAPDTGNDDATDAADATADDAPDATTATEPAPTEVDRNEFVPIEGVPGVSDDEISVAVVGIREFNPLGTCILDCYITGVQAYFDYINDGGGIYGRDLVIGEEIDDQLFQNQQAALDIISNNASFASFQATLGASGWGDLHDAGIPNFVWNIHATESANRDTVFGHIAAVCATCTSRAVPWLASISDSTTVATLGYGDSENSRVCAESLADSVEFYGDDLGLTVGYRNPNLEFGLAGGIGPEVTQMKEAGVDFIATCIDLNGMRTLADELVRQNYRDQVTMYHPNTYDVDFVAEAGNLFDGDYVIPQFAAFEYDTGSELKALYDEWVPRHGGPTAEQTMIGWINADTMLQGLLAAGPDFDRQKVIDGLNNLTYTADGLINPIEWGRQHVPPTENDTSSDYELECLSAVQMQDGGFVGFQPAPFMCWPNDTSAWSDPVPTNFAAG